VQREKTTNERKKVLKDGLGRDNIEINSKNLDWKSGFSNF